MFREVIIKTLKIKDRKPAWLALHMNIHPSALSNYLSGKKATLKCSKIEEIFEFLGIELKLPKD